MKNTSNDIEALATAQAVVLAGASLGNDTNAIEQIATDKAAALAYEGNDDNKLEKLAALLA